MHHAFFIEGNIEEGTAQALAHLKKEFGIDAKKSPDVMVLTYGLLAAEDARRISALAGQAPVQGDTKAIVIAANRAYHEAQNALLKVFEEPPADTVLFLILPSSGALLPTLRSRVAILGSSKGASSARDLSPEAAAFLKASVQKRSALIKKLSTGKDEEERRENRDAAIALINGIEEAAYASWKKKPSADLRLLLTDIAVLRGYLHERSAPVRMILEHLSLVTPSGLV